MHVIHVISEPSRGGAELLVRELNARLPTIGVHSSAVYFMNPKTLPLASNEITLNLINPWDIRAVFKLRQVVVAALKSSPDLIVHAHLTQPQYLVPFAVAGLPVTTLFTEHSSHNKRRSMRFMRPVERINYRLYREVICISNGTADALKTWIGSNHPTKVSVVLNGARLFQKVGRTAGDRMRLVSVGSLNERKGFDVAIEAVSKIAEQVEKYTIVGAGPEQQRLESQVQRCGLERKVDFVGWNTEIEPFLASANIFVLPSRWEGFGLVAVEALSTGMPIVCSDVDGLREVAEHCDAAMLFPKEDAAALAQMCIDIFSNLKEGHDYSDDAVRHASRFSLDIMTKQYANIYKSYVEKRL